MNTIRAGLATVGVIALVVTPIALHRSAELIWLVVFA